VKHVDTVLVVETVLGFGKLGVKQI